jgi:hypothetical protein
MVARGVIAWEVGARRGGAGRQAHIHGIAETRTASQEPGQLSLYRRFRSMPLN